MDRSLLVMLRSTSCTPAGFRAPSSSKWPANWPASFKRRLRKEVARGSPRSMAQGIHSAPMRSRPNSPRRSRRTRRCDRRARASPRRGRGRRLHSAAMSATTAFTRLGIAAGVDAAVDQDVLHPVVGGNVKQEAVAEPDAVHPHAYLAVARHAHILYEARRNPYSGSRGSGVRNAPVVLSAQVDQKSTCRFSRVRLFSRL